MKLTDELLDSYIEYQTPVADEASNNTPAVDILNVLKALRDGTLEISRPLTKKQKVSVRSDLSIMFMMGGSDMFGIEKRIMMLAGMHNKSTGDIIDWLKEEEIKKRVEKGLSAESPKFDKIEQHILRVKQDEMEQYETCKER